MSSTRQDGIDGSLPTRRAATDRRGFLSFASQGIGATALLSLLRADGLVAGEAKSAAAADSSRRPFDVPPKAKRVVQICVIGGLSHVDSFDYKPKLEKLHGQPASLSEKPDLFFGKVGPLRKEDFKFKPRGQSGLWISDLFPHIAAQADSLTVIRSMMADSANHTPALYVENSGFQFSGFPSLGSWMGYGLGNEAEDLPAYVVLPDPRGLPNGGASIWSSGFLPAVHQGVLLKNGSVPVRELFPFRAIDPKTEAASRELLRELNETHADGFGADEILAARMHNYELAARMQRAIPDVVDLSAETNPTRSLYGLDDAATAGFGRNCLLARRLLERGVRFVQLFSGGPIAGSPRASWDAHESVRDNHSSEAARIDKPVAGLLSDLRERGLLNDTLVLFTTEFGRTPFTESAANVVGTGRDHNKYGFSVWMAGGGLRPGIAYGATDEIGWKAVEHPCTWHDFHATVLHLLGIDHEKLTFYHNGIARRLTNVHGHVIKQVIA